MIAEADEAFSRGDYLRARTLYAAVLADATASEEERARAQTRLLSLRADKLALWLGLGTLTFVVVAYVLARLLG